MDASKTLLDEICADTHRLSHRLHPSQLAFVGLTSALSTFCAEFGRQNGVEIDFNHDEMPDLPSAVKTCLYRVAQEAIRNAEKHSGSRHIRLQLAARSDSVWLCVSDSGRGLRATEVESSGLGLMSMAERVRSVGGELFVRSDVDRGTSIEASVPLPARSSLR